ncbi:hypothetical protein ACNKU7_18685 [Microbulbifer sp. SA54]|uniref:hypothetical protein n=1 Tax=Microbulbifer sp. SA54 TaxID=3401577 RepID=UPI003AAF9ABB
MTNANATTILKILAAIELSSDDRIDQDFAVALLEFAASELSLGNSDEKFILGEAVDSLLEHEELLTIEEKEFYENFMENFGLL